MTLQLADRSRVYLTGKIEDVLVKEDKFIFSVDFIVLDFEANKKALIILGRPFLATGNTLIDVQKGELTMKVNDQQVTFNVLDAIKSFDEMEDCHFVSIMELNVANSLNNCCSNEEIKAATFEELKDEDAAAAHIAWLEEKQHVRTNRHFESLDLSNREVKLVVPYIELPFVLELKLLLSHLKYFYLGDNNTLLVIILSSLNVDQEKSLVDMLGRYKKAIGWTTTYIKEISPSICMYKILLEDCYNSSVE